MQAVAVLGLLAVLRLAAAENSPLSVTLEFRALEDAESTVEAFCGTHTISLRNCHTVLERVEGMQRQFISNATDRGLAPSNDVLRLQLNLSGHNRDRDARLDNLQMCGSFGIRTLLRLMHGRDVLDDNGLFIFPPEVTDVFVDVGAHHWAWKYWPLTSNPRLIGLPFAVDTLEDSVTLHVTPYDHASGLVRPDPSHFGGAATAIQVQSIRLERVLRSIPSHLRIAYLKTDCQSKDLDVLVSAGPELRRVALLVTELIFKPQEWYPGAPATTSPTSDLLHLLLPMGFAVTYWSPDINLVEPPQNVSQVDMQFLNLAHATKQLVSELWMYGQTWRWDEEIMARYYDPEVPGEALHAPGGDGTKWLYGFAPR